jgi:hypothetical protein
LTSFDDDFGVFPGAFVFKGLAGFSGSQVVTNIPAACSGIGKHKKINPLIGEMRSRAVLRTRMLSGASSGTFRAKGNPVGLLGTEIR